MKLLETRIRPIGHSDLKGAMYLSCKNIHVNKLNEKGCFKDIEWIRQEIPDWEK
mgnify:CR=1 FL=1